MSEENNKSLVPHFTIGAVVLVVLAALIFWPSEPEPLSVVAEVPPMVVPETVEPIIDEPLETTLLDETENNTEAKPQPIPEVAPQPLDTSDGTVKTKLLQLSDYDSFARLIIDDALLERFVVMTNNLAEEEISGNNRVLVPLDKPFRTYQQADKQWIDPASFKRYSPYVDVLASLETQSLLQLYAEYKPAIDDIFAEISSPSATFNGKLKQAIDILLDTPEIPMPVEVYTDSVMFKFADPQLESLSAPQKQLLRTGPENMRRIKAKLREIKEAL
ncbi:DUF3014 domain-containing protein [Paraglaciecola hydrolytica]|uniref:DUF3014 domain-containing protein n=1 Tax=Paraglaciecola hydrolytica TaxID=1799789 RepID=A0A136A3Q3_9ALTE|nr:DUF3014 domain-containing protein [Paraglaciecola hydrolytica]KXI29861.1 hypothetical protein AX660_07475 [Paraglaciecola hydrolytica]